MCRWHRWAPGAQGAQRPSRPAISTTGRRAAGVLGGWALVAVRQQRNPVGWQLLAVGVFGTATLLGESYTRYALITAPGSLPGGLYGTWLGWTYAPTLAILAIFLPLYFPTGRLLSPRWRPVVWFGIGFLAFAVAGNALWPGPDPPLLGLAPVPNPMVYLPQAKPLFELFRNLAGLCSLAGVAGAIAALVVRFRRSRGIERQQLKWFTYAAALAPLPFFTYEFAPSISGLLRTLILPLVPISIGIAILRYRLYEIDRIINRTLVHGLLTVVLGLGYAAGSWIGASTAASTTPPRPSRHSPAACASRSTSTPSPASCWRSSTRPWSRPKPHCGFDLPHPAPRAQLPVRHGLLPGPTEHHPSSTSRVFKRQNISATAH